MLLPLKRRNIGVLTFFIASVSCFALISDTSVRCTLVPRNIWLDDDVETIIPLRKGTYEHPAHDIKKLRSRSLVEELLLLLHQRRSGGASPRAMEETDACLRRDDRSRALWYYGPECRCRPAPPMPLAEACPSSFITLISTPEAHRRGIEWLMRRAVEVALCRQSAPAPFGAEVQVDDLLVDFHRFLLRTSSETCPPTRR